MWRSLLTLAVLSALVGGAARAQNLDQGKSAPKLFADGCATCHRSARGLAKGRFSLTLFMFLRDHYATNATSAWALTSYLESVDSAPRGRARTAAAKPSAPAHHSAESSPRPPTPVPQR
jgi:mono/diheme cytochrome c family protein